MFLNQRGDRLSVKGHIITGIATASRLEDRQRASCATPSRHGSCEAATDLVIVVELLGHARLETTRRLQPTDRAI